LEALDATGKLTAIGRQMSFFPVEPSFAKVLLSSKVKEF
jgi:HrpA-like RNA helicase